MTLKQGENTVLVPGREKSGGYKLRFTRVLGGEIKELSVTNGARATGPMLFSFSIPTDVQLGGGDHEMEVLNGSTVVWSEQVRVR